MLKNILKRFTLIFIVAMIWSAARVAQAGEWQTYTDSVAGYAFEYPADSHLSTGLDASQGYQSVFVAIGDQGYSIAVLNNTQNLPLDQFLIERKFFDPAQGQRVKINELEALQVSPESAWVQLDQVALKIELYAADDPIAFTPASRAAFDRVLATLRSIPRSSTIDPLSIDLNQPSIGIADQFQAPLAAATTIQYETQWNVITSDTRYGVRNLALATGRKCYGVAWNRMLHSGIDLYRLDGQSANGTTVVAAADGQVAYYDPAYLSYPGHVIIIRHQLADNSVIYSMYAHMNAVYIYQGQNVVRGQPIGTVLFQQDSKYPDDSHLHFEMRKFLDGTWIYPSWTTCNGLVYGRGYSYLIHPDNFPTANGYINPDAFIQAHGGSPLTPIGLPDAIGPLVNYAASVNSTQPITDSEPLTYTAYLPLIVYEKPRPEPACVEGQNLLANGSFEDGVGSAPWVQVRNSSSDLISTYRPYAGAQSLWLGGRDGADEETLQSFMIPYETEGVTLTFKRYLMTQETDPIVYDHFELVLENQTGNEISPQITFTNLSGANVWRAESAAFTGFQAWGGRRLRLSLKGMTDWSLPTSLFVDELSLQTKCAP
jgi:murein DD-endopeptidase MepM/ murein hydrolase activator NlpD